MKISVHTRPNDYTYRIEPDISDGLLYHFVMGDFSYFYDRMEENFRINGREVSQRERLCYLRSARYTLGFKEMAAFEEEADSLCIAFTDGSYFGFSKEKLNIKFM